MKFLVAASEDPQKFTDEIEWIDHISVWSLWRFKSAATDLNHGYEVCVGIVEETPLGCILSEYDEDFETFQPHEELYPDLEAALGALEKLTDDLGIFTEHFEWKPASRTPVSGN